jgi:hypothetical protein
MVKIFGCLHEKIRLWVGSEWLLPYLRSELVRVSVRGGRTREKGEREEKKGHEGRRRKDTRGREEERERFPLTILEG